MHARQRLRGVADPRCHGLSDGQARVGDVPPASGDGSELRPDGGGESQDLRPDDDAHARRAAPEPGRYESASRAPQHGARTAPPGLRHLDEGVAVTDRRPAVLSRLVDRPVASVAAGNPSAPTIRRAETVPRPGGPFPTTKPDGSSVVPPYGRLAVQEVITHAPHIEAVHQRLGYNPLERPRCGVASNDPLASS